MERKPRPSARAGADYIVIAADDPALLARAADAAFARLDPVRNQADRARDITIRDGYATVQIHTIINRGNPGLREELRTLAVDMAAAARVALKAQR